MRWPLLAVFAADENSDIIDYCWLSWLTASITTNWEESVTGHCESFVTYAQYLIEKAVQTGFIAALHLSFIIFYPESPIIFLMEYLNNTYRHDFSNDTTFKLKNYLHTLNSQEMIPNIFKSRSECINYSIKILVVHLDNNFQSLLHQQYFLETLCESDISYFNTIVDFCLLKQVLDIIEFTEVEISNFHFFCRDSYTDEDIRDEYVKIRNKLVAHKHYEKALELSSVLKMDKDNIIYQSWVNGYEADPDNYDIDLCEADTQKYCIKPILMLNFYIYISKQLTSHLNRYRILKKVLTIIKKYQLYYEFDRDAIEYEMLLAYVKFETELQLDTDSNCSSMCVELEIYHSEYHENVFTKERGVLHNSFVELKEIAGIDDLTVVNRKLEGAAEIGRLENLINSLLEKGDIIQALRCQAMFDHRPIDLHFIVFCMALAEDIVTIYDLPKAERRLLNENLNTVAIRFNKRTLRRDRISQCKVI
jgi:spatacsin